MNLVEYTLQVRDMASKPLMKVYNSIVATNRAAEHAKTGMAKVPQMSGLAGMFSKFTAGAAIAGAAYKAVDFFTSTAQAAMDRQQIRTSFDVLSGGEEAGKRLTDQLVALQKDTVLGAEVFKNAQTMLGFGFDSTEVAGNMKMLGDVAMGDAQKLESLTLAFSQVRAGGKLTGQDLMQFINAGFNPLQQISESTGKSIETLRDEMSAGNLSFEDVRQAFRDATGEGGKFYQMLDKMAQTDAGMAQQLAGAWAETKIKIGQAIQPLTRSLLEAATAVLPIVEKCIVPLSSLITGIVDGIKSLKPYVMEFVEPVMTFVGQLRDGISVIAAFIANVARTVVEHVYPVIGNVAKILLGIVGRLAEFISKSELIQDIFSAISYVVRTVAVIVSGWIDTLAKYLNMIFTDIIMPIIEGIEKAYKWVKGIFGFGKTETSAKVKNTANPANDAAVKDKIVSTAHTAASNKSAIQNSNQAISSAGPKQVTINVQKFFDNINFNTTSLRESSEKIEQTVLEVLSRVLVQGASQAV